MKHSVVIVAETIENKIFLIRGQKVIIDYDIAKIFGIATKVLNQAVKRNIDRFPRDFMFVLTKAEKNELVTNCDRFNSLKHSTALPYAFNEHGAVMLATILNSPSAVEASIYVVRAFIRMREFLSEHKELAQKLKELELKFVGHDEQIRDIIEAINQLLTPPEKPKRQIGFQVKEKLVRYAAK